MRTYFLLAFVFFSSYNSNAQYKRDIGLKLNSFNQERLEIEYRWHLNENWISTIGLTFGERGTYHFITSVDSDTTFIYNADFTSRNYYGMSIGASRKLNAMKHNFYYIGSKLNFGAIDGVLGNSEIRFSSVDNPNYVPFYGEELSAVHSSESFKGYFGSLRLFVGADYPILDRLLLNVELGALMNLSNYNYLSYGNYSLGQVGLIANAGLRYRFGKDSE